MAEQETARAIAEQLTCRHGYNHYCANCGNSIDPEPILAAITAAEARGRAQAEQAGRQAMLQEVLAMTLEHHYACDLAVELRARAAEGWKA